MKIVLHICLIFYFLFSGKVETQGKHFLKKRVMNSSEMNLSGMKLEEIPDTVFNTLNLRKLYLHNNSIERISGEISILEELEFLDLSANPIKEISDSIAILDDLKVLVILYTDLSFEQYQKLLCQLPNCNIFYYPEQLVEFKGLYSPNQMMPTDSKNSD